MGANALQVGALVLVAVAFAGWGWVYLGLVVTSAALLVLAAVLFLVAGFRRRRALREVP